MRRIAPLFLVLLLLSLPLAAAQPPRSSPPPSPSALAAVGAQLVAYLHELVGRFLPAADSHGTMDPNGGAHPQDDSHGTMDPDGHS